VPYNPADVAHLTAPADDTVPRTRTGALRHRAAVVGALLSGIALGTTGLATAGVLGPLQAAAHSVATKAGVGSHIPEPKVDGHGANSTATDNAKDVGAPRFRDAAACPLPSDAPNDIVFNNHGQYVRVWTESVVATDEQRAAATASDCGKPLSSVNKPAVDGADKGG
jgi:hypothetical protein